MKQILFFIMMLFVILNVKITTNDFVLMMLKSILMMIL